MMTSELIKIHNSLFEDKGSKGALNNVASVFEELSKELKYVDEKYYIEAEQLSESLINPLNASAQEIWSALWDKPLYAGVRVDSGRRWTNEVRHLLNDFEEIKRSHFDFIVSRRSVWDRQSYECKSELFHNLCEASNAHVKNWYCISSAFQYLVHLESSVSEDFLRSAMPGRSIPSDSTSLTLQALPFDKVYNQAGGHITVMHFLTDCGVCIKPDIHVSNSLKFFCLADCGTAATARPGFKEASRLSDAVIQLTKLIFPDLEGFDMCRRLRFVDKVLMGISQVIFQHCEYKEFSASGKCFGH